MRTLSTYKSLQLHQEDRDPCCDYRGLLTSLEAAAALKVQDVMTSTAELSEPFIAFEVARTLPPGEFLVIKLTLADAVKVQTGRVWPSCISSYPSYIHENEDTRKYIVALILNYLQKNIPAALPACTKNCVEQTLSKSKPNPGMALALTAPSLTALVGNYNGCALFQVMPSLLAIACQSETWTPLGELTGSSKICPTML